LLPPSHLLSFQRSRLERLAYGTFQCVTILPYPHLDRAPHFFLRPILRSSRPGFHALHGRLIRRQNKHQFRLLAEETVVSRLEVLEVRRRRQGQRSRRHRPAALEDAQFWLRRTIRTAKSLRVTGGGHPRWSGRVEARIGLRMMPTFPRPSLSFRTVSFPQYGWKVGLSDGACLYIAQLKPAPGIRCSSSSLRPSFVHFAATSMAPL